MFSSVCSIEWTAIWVKSTQPVARNLTQKWLTDVFGYQKTLKHWTAGWRETHSRRPMAAVCVCVCCGRKSRRPPPGEVNLEKESGEMSGQVLHEMLPAAATAQGHRVLGHFNIETNKNEKKCSSSSVSLWPILTCFNCWSRDVSVDCHLFFLYGTVWGLKTMKVEMGCWPSDSAHSTLLLEWIWFNLNDLVNCYRI